MRTNCKNCAAPLNYQKCRCEYCETPIFAMEKPKKPIKQSKAISFEDVLLQNQKFVLAVAAGLFLNITSFEPEKLKSAKA